MHYFDFNIQFSLAVEPHLIDVKRYGVFKCLTPFTFLRFPKFGHKICTSVLGIAALASCHFQHWFPGTEHGRCYEFVSLRPDLPSFDPQAFVLCLTHVSPPTLVLRLFLGPLFSLLESGPSQSYSKKSEMPV